MIQEIISWYIGDPGNLFFGSIILLSAVGLIFDRFKKYKNFWLLLAIMAAYMSGLFTGLWLK